MYPGTFLGRALWADSASSPMNTIASRNQFRPIKYEGRTRQSDGTRKKRTALLETWGGGVVSSRLVCMNMDRAVLVRALARDIVLCSWARHYSHIASLHPGV